MINLEKKNLIPTKILDRMEVRLISLTISKISEPQVIYPLFSFLGDFWGFNKRNPYFNFENMFGSNSRPLNRGSDILIELEITFLESVNGTYRMVEVEKLQECETCEGTRHKPKPEKCPRCGGTGMLNFR